MLTLAKRGFVPLFCLAFLAGCASSGVSRTGSKVANETIPEPPRVVIGEFSSSPERIPQRPELAGHFDERDKPVTAGEIELGRQLGERVAVKLVEDLNGMGINAVRQAAAGQMALNDALVEGYFVTVDEGSRLQRVLIGFGAGAAELRTLVEFYQMTDTGLRDLGFAEIEAEGSKMPGMVVPLGVGAATDNVLRSAAIGGGIAAVKEIGPETLDAAAERTAAEISSHIRKSYEKRGWM